MPAGCHAFLSAMNLGRYHLVGEIARGGMGIVWLAETRGPGGFSKRCVVKELKPELARDSAFRDMFLDEARLAARLCHRNIVQTHEVARAGSRWFMALELLDGCSLARAQKVLGSALPLRLGLRVLCEVLAALHHAHELRDEHDQPLGVVHRDVSPNNVFLTFDGQVKLLDFGVAKSRDRRRFDSKGQLSLELANETQAGIVKGSIPYMSPDHVSEATIDRRADVFAVGVLLHEMLVGQRLWEGLDDLAVIRRLVAGDIPALPTDRPIPEALRAICTRALAKTRTARFADAEQMRAALLAYVAENDPHGSLTELGELLERALGHERGHLGTMLAGTAAAEEPPTLASALLETATQTGQRLPRKALVHGGAALLVASLAVVLAVRDLPTLSSRRASAEEAASSPDLRGRSAPSIAVPPVEPAPTLATTTVHRPRPVSEPRPPEVTQELPPNPYDTD